MTTTYGIYLLVFGAAVFYLGLRFRNSIGGSEPVDGVPGFRPRIGFSRFDGMQSISLVLENESTERIRVEEIEISLTDLIAEDQTANASCRETLRIRQTIEAEDALPISLAGVIYKAAGDPQREYSCTMSSVLRFRIGDESFERNLADYRIRMIGLTASGAQRERKRTPRRQPATHMPAEPQGIAAVAAKFK